MILAGWPALASWPTANYIVVFVENSEGEQNYSYRANTLLRGHISLPGQQAPAT